MSRHFADGLPSVRANPYSLEEVLLNLLTNARDAIEEREAHHGHISVTTRLSTNGSGGSIVCMDVRDNGRGIPEAVEEKIFDPFFTTKDPDKGTGLGLSICKSIVEDLKGSLEIVSTPGMGVTATVSLPALKS